LSPISIPEAALLGVVEGLTELLPVSSTGHLILVSRLLGDHGDAGKALEVVIQLGAVVAVAVYFRARIADSLRGLLRRDAASIRLWGALLAAFVPTAIVGLLLSKTIKAHLFGPVPVAAALIAGGVLMIALERVAPAPAEGGIERIRIADGLIIGLCQCLSLWPGTSRSMTTIVGGRFLRFDTKAAAEFSFLLALPTLGAATLYDFYKNGHHILAMPGGPAALGVGLAVSFVVTWLVVAAFLRYVGRIGLMPFGVYRIVLGLAVLALAFL
jgi:undecaprenyl-diphosphatase